jgi:hypothetical protein
MAQTLAPYIGDRVLEIGAGIGTLTSQFIPREFTLLQTSILLIFLPARIFQWKTISSRAAYQRWSSG